MSFLTNSFRELSWERDEVHLRDLVRAGDRASVDDGHVQALRSEIERWEPDAREAVAEALAHVREAALPR